MPAEMRERGGAIDPDHLDRATSGDRDLQRELLGMLRRQLAEARTSLRSLCGHERWMVAHAVKGAASGLGAFALAECAADIERDPDDDTHLERFDRLADAVETFIGSLEA